MDFWARLVGGNYTPRKPTASQANDPKARLTRFKRVHTTVQHLCDQPRNLAKERHTLDELQKLFDKLAQYIREESRAPAPHLCLQYAAANRIYALITRAAIVSHHEGLIFSAITLLSTLIDSEEEDFLSSEPFAKSLMRLVTRVVDSGNLLLGIETETAILELLFTIAAKIRLQPYILPVWFASSAKAESDDVFKEKKDFVGATQADDFPLCYLLIGRVHHEGRIGDFARTGLLYIFEATGRSADLEEWVVSSDLPTLMASGLGALYSQLSRELSILHPDATLPAVLAMSDYSTTHARATAESAFSERHRAHIATFLSYLAFWQDILDHCRSADVKQTLLDHFQILFLQQLLYPSILQSSDTDAGSSVAVLTYVSTILEAIEYPDLIHNIMTYLLAITDAPKPADMAAAKPRRPSMPPRSPTAVKRRQSLLQMTAPPNPEDTVEPTLFNLVDLIINSLGSSNAQTVYAALNLSSTILNRQKKYALEKLVKVQSPGSQGITRTVGMLESEIERFMALSSSLYEMGAAEAYVGLSDDVRSGIEAQISLSDGRASTTGKGINVYLLPKGDPFMRLLMTLMRTFFTNSIDVNLALTQTLASIALCIEMRLDGWFALDASHAQSSDDTAGQRAENWEAFLDDDEQQSLSALQLAARRPTWPQGSAPVLYNILQLLAYDFDAVRAKVPNLDQLISGRKNMLQAANFDAPVVEPASPMPSHVEPTTRSPGPSQAHSRNSSISATRMHSRSRSQAANTETNSHLTPSPADMRPSEATTTSPPQRLVFQPPPPETPSTTDVLMQEIAFPAVSGGSVESGLSTDGAGRTASLNHVLTNVVVLQEFVLELTAILQVRAAVLGEQEVKFVV